MRISVIIVTHNRKCDLEITLPSFLKQNYPDYEIIVIDNASNDGTKEYIAENFPDVKYFFLPDNYEIRAINIGVEMSSGDVIWRTDSDSCPASPDVFRRVADILTAYPNIDIIGTGEMLAHKNNEIWDWYPLEHDLDNVPPQGYRSNTFVGTGAAIRRKVFDAIGGFWGFGFEELDFSTRAIVAGFHIRYFPDLRVIHYVKPSVRNFSERWIIISRQYVRYNCKYFPLMRTIGRLFVIFNSQILLALFQKVSPAAFLEGILEMNAVAIHTFRHERQPAPKELLSEITLNTSIAKSQFKFFYETFLHKIRHLFGK